MMKDSMFGPSLAGIIGVAGGVIVTLSLAACTPAQMARVEVAEAAAFKVGQLFCAYATATGPLIVAAATVLAPSGVVVIGMTDAAVKAVCRAINDAAIPVNTPAGASPAVTPMVTTKVAP